MKNAVLLFLSLCLTGMVMGQGIQIVPSDTLEVDYDLDQFGNDYIYVKNTSKNPMELKYELLTNTFADNDWEATICTNIGCYPNIPKKGSMGTIRVGDKGFFNLHADFKGHKGTGTVTFKVYDPTEAATADTLTFLYRVHLTATVDPISAETKLYPNPAAHDLTLQLPTGIEVEQVELVSSGWIKPLSFTVQANHFIQVKTDNIPAGIYFVSVKTKNSDQPIIKTFVKQ